MRLSQISLNPLPQPKSKANPPRCFPQSSPTLNIPSRLSSKWALRPSFGIVFDIDGVILRGDAPVGGSPCAVRRLHDDSTGSWKVPYVFLTNGGGVPESERALKLGKQLGVNILSSQIIQGHTPFKQLAKRYEKELVIAVGEGEPAAVMSTYGFQNVLPIDKYASCFDDIDPLAHYRNVSDRNNIIRSFDCSRMVQAIFVVSDSTDWSRDIQVLCDILRTGGLPTGSRIANQPPLYFANCDLEYQDSFACERLGMGAFRIALESVFNRIHPTALEYTTYGKPNPSVFSSAETILRELVHSSFDTIQSSNHQIGEKHAFRTLYMVGDNPLTDIKGARQVGHPWFTILTRTGIFKGKENHDEYPADLVVDTVEEAVDYILKKEGI